MAPLSGEGHTGTLAQVTVVRGLEPVDAGFGCIVHLEEWAAGRLFAGSEWWRGTSHRVRDYRSLCSEEGKLVPLSPHLMPLLSSWCARAH